MRAILVPGFWLAAGSWAEVVPVIEAAGHEAVPVTLPGMGSADDDRSAITLADHVAAVVALIDASDEPVALVGHSGGASVVHQAADARPGRVARLVYVDAAPPSPGDPINADLPVVDGEIPLPDWSEFGDEDLDGLTPELRERFRATAVPQPALVATQGAVLEHDARHGIPATMIACSMPASMVQQLVEAGHPFAAEWAAMSLGSVVELPTGHWPQFSKPVELGTVIAAALG